MKNIKNIKKLITSIIMASVIAMPFASINVFADDWDDEGAVQKIQDEQPNHGSKYVQGSKTTSTSSGITIPNVGTYPINYFQSWANSYALGHPQDVISAVQNTGYIKVPCIARQRKYLYTEKEDTGKKDKQGKEIYDYTDVYTKTPAILVKFTKVRTDSGWDDIGTDHYTWTDKKVKWGTVAQNGINGIGAGTLYHADSSATGATTKNWSTAADWTSQNRLQYVTVWGMGQNSFITFKISNTPWDKFRKWTKTYVEWQVITQNWVGKYWRSTDKDMGVEENTNISGSSVAIKKTYTSDPIKIQEMQNKKATHYVTYQTPDQGHPYPIPTPPPKPGPNPPNNNNNNGGNNNSGWSTAGDQDANWVENQTNADHLDRGDTRTELVGN